MVDLRELVKHATVEDLLAEVGRLESGNSGDAQKIYAAAQIIAARQLDRAAARLQVWGLAIAAMSLLVAIVALAVTVLV